MEVEQKRMPRVRFSLRALIAAITIVAVGFGAWIAYSKYRIQRVLELRQQGAIVIVRDGTPQWLQAIGISQLSPFYDVPTVELYVTPLGDDALVGASATMTSRGNAQNEILAWVATARSCGADDIQLILVDSFDGEWTAFAQEHSLTTISDSKERYHKRLRANQESGANINP